MARILTDDQLRELDRKRLSLLKGNIYTTAVSIVLASVGYLYHQEWTETKIEVEELQHKVEELKRENAKLAWEAKDKLEDFNKLMDQYVEDARRSEISVQELTRQRDNCLRGRGYGK